MHRYAGNLRSGGKSLSRNGQMVNPFSSQAASLLLRLQTSIDALDEKVKECFLDLGSFPEDDRIAGTILEDMWVELYRLDDEGMYASENLLDLYLRNLINLVPIRYVL